MSNAILKKRGLSLKRGALKIETDAGVAQPARLQGLKRQTSMVVETHNLEAAGSRPAPGILKEKSWLDDLLLHIALKKPAKSLLNQES